MAPPPDHVYFPPLGELLEGERVLLSWQLIAASFADGPDFRLAADTVTSFLSDAYVQSLLRAPATAFSQPSAQTAAALETRTAAINVVPATTDRYDVTTLKADAVWLSRCVGIDEVAALRLVVVELQTRAQAFLAAAPLSSQDATNISKAAVETNALVVAVAAEAVEDADTLWAAFGRPEQRRQRLLATYLAERRSFAYAMDLVVSFCLGESPEKRELDDDYENDNDSDNDGHIKAALDTLRAVLVRGLFGAADLTSFDPRTFLPVLPALVTELQACMARANKGLEATATDAGDDVVTGALALDWVQTALAEAVHYMAVVFWVLTSSGPTFLPPTLTAEWFRFVGDHGFLDSQVAPDAELADYVPPLHTLACAISLVLLDVDRAIAYLDHDLDLESDEEPYVNNADVLEIVHDAVLAAATAGLPAASPVVLSWSLVLHRMDVSYQDRAERRDLAQNQRAQDGFELELQPPHVHALQSRGRRSSVGSIVSIEAARYDAFLSERVLTATVQDGEPLVPRLAQLATDALHVFDVVAAMAACAGSGHRAVFRPRLGARLRLVFLDLLKASLPVVGYQAEPLTALVGVLGGAATDDGPSYGPGRDNDAVVSAVLDDPQLMQFYVGNALSRFPYEFLPFVTLCRALAAGADSVLDTLLQTPTLTLTLPPGFDSYAMVDDPAHASATMQTLEDLPLFPPTALRRRLAYSADKRVAAVVVPAGTFGRFMVDGSGIVHLDFEHSTLALLGKLLDAYLNREIYDTVLASLDPPDVAAVVGLLTALVRAEVRKHGDASAGLAVLEEASRDLDPAKDIVTVLCDLLNANIEDGPVAAAAPDDARNAIRAACIDFLRELLPLCPGRVWSYMARCRLLNTAASAGRLCILAGAADVAGDRFAFLMAAVRLLAGLVDSAVRSAVQRRVIARKPSPLTARSNSGNNNSSSSSSDHVWLGASEKIVAEVSLAVAQTVVDVYENTNTWRFASEVHRAALVAGAVDILRDMVVFASSLEGAASGESLARCFEAASAFVLRSFLTSSSAALRFQPLLTTLVLSYELPQTTLYRERRRPVVRRVTAVLAFAATLLRLAHVGSTNDQEAPAFETHIFQIATLPARLCASEATVRPALSLLTDLVATAAARASEPPSLLGYLGPHVARSFLGVLLALDRPFQRPAEVARVWTFFATILRHRQQWMANSLLTGKTPREALQQTDCGGERSTRLSPDSVLLKAKDALRGLATAPAIESAAVLAFFTAAQNYWPWAIMAAIRGGGSSGGGNDNDYESLLAYVRDLEPAAVRARTDAQAACHEARMAALVAESLAMQLYHLRQMGTEQVLARDVLQSIDYYVRDGVAVGGYNASLHANFQRNVAQRYPGCTLEQFKWSSSTAGRDRDATQFFYALRLADRMLGDFDPSGWAGARATHKGFRREMAAANRNLALVDAQIALLHAWEVLLLELSVCLLPRTPRLTVLMLQVAEQCLAANQASHQGPERVFSQLAQRRANLALLLLQRLAEHALLPADVSSLLLVVWTSIHAVEQPWSPTTAPYYRTLLRILYVVLQGGRKGAAPEGGDNTMVVSTTQTVLNLLDRVVAQGFRTLVSLAHEPDAVSKGSQPEDMALLTAVLQACLSTPGLRQCETQVLNVMAGQDVLRVATSLFSWSDRLRVDDGRDPVYGELSLLFLRELATLPAVAEQLASDGFLSHLVSAALAGHMQRGLSGAKNNSSSGGISPFSDAPTAQRYYSIWAKALLPLLLHILMALGTSVAPEVAYVLNQFPGLLAASAVRVEAPGLRRTDAVTSPAHLRGGRGHLTLMAVSEVHTLALLTRVLAALRIKHARDIPTVRHWEDVSGVLESVEVWLSRPKLLRERLVPLGPRELEWRAMAPTTAAAGLFENRLEEKVVQLLEATRTILGEDEE